jgi:hypothetical protein
LGYADVGEGSTKRERKNSDAGPKKEFNEDDDGEDDDDKQSECTRQALDTGNRLLQRKVSNGSPELRRMGSKDHSYFDSNSPKGRDAPERGKDIRPSFGEYRESAGFSEDGHSPLGILSCSGDIV